MKYVLGIDGGGTKTAYLLCREDGSVAAQCTGTGCSYKQHGTDAALQTLQEHIDEVLHTAGATREDVAGICAGLPCYGEAPAQDEAFLALLKEKLAPIPLLAVNDAEVGWAGSLAARPGINIVAGTGSIAFGMDATGKCARSGGWSWVFGDEGSCHWAGMKAMELFCKEADGRAEKSALYTLLREELHLENDMDFVEIMENDYYPVREKTAGLQTILYKAALAGDKAARNAYGEAAEELAMLVRGVHAQLELPADVCVSYSGGIFRTGETILAPFRAKLPSTYTLCTPLLSPVEGAALLALRSFMPQCEAAAADYMLKHTQQ